MDPDVLMIGCGDLGSRIALRLAARGHRVLALRRRAGLVPSPVRGLSVDLTREAPELPPLDLRHLVVALTARPRTEDAYRATYVEGLRRALDAVAAAGQCPVRAVLISSTGVHGDAPAGALVDEDVPPGPRDGPARALLEAEQLFASRLPTGTVLRCSGLYDGGRSRLVERVRSGQMGDLGDLGRWTNRIHRDDAAGAAVHLLTRPETPGPLYVATDDEPALLGDVVDALARRLRVPGPPPAGRPEPHGKRLSNARLRATGWVPAYPSHREGYGS